VKPGRKPDSWYRQSGVVAVRVRDGEPQVLLVTSAGGKRWVIPKGIVESDHTPASSAAKEAWEEAGVTGKVSRRMIGRYRYAKWNGICTVLVYRLDVEEIHRTWPEAHVRRRKWLAPAAAAARIGSPELAQLIIETFPRRSRA